MVGNVATMVLQVFVLTLEDDSTSQPGRKERNPRSAGQFVESLPQHLSQGDQYVDSSYKGESMAASVG